MRLVAKPALIAEGLWLSGEMHATEEGETIPSNLRVEEEGELIQGTFIGEQTLAATCTTAASSRSRRARTAASSG